MANNKGSINVVDLQLATWREQMLNRLLPLTAAMATIGVIVGVISVIERDRLIYIPIYVGAYLVLVGITFVRRLSYKSRALVLLALIGILGVTILTETGLSGEGRSFLLVLPIAAMVLLGWRQSLLGLVLSSAIFLLFGVLELPAASPVDPRSLINWLLAAVLAAMLGLGLILSLQALLQNLISTVREEQRSRQELGDISDHLHQKIAKRNLEMERCSSQLAVGAAMSRALAAELDPDQLAKLAADLLRDRLNFYHIGLYLLEPQREHAYLQAAAGERAAEMLASGTLIEAGDESLVARCLAQGEGRMADHVGELGNWALPETRSALALPLRADERVIGVLEMQSTQSDAFDEQDSIMLQDTADQIALAMENARTLADLRNELVEMQLANRQYLRQAWHEYGEDDEVNFAEFHQPDLLGWTPSEVQMLTGARASQEGRTLVIPLALHGQVIGQMVVEPPSGEANWADEKMELLGSVAEQATSALESVRLYDETQRSAAEGRIVGDITTRIRETLDIDTILRTAVREIGETLDLAEVQVRMKSDAG